MMFDGFFVFGHFPTWPGKNLYHFEGKLRSQKFSLSKAKLSKIDRRKVLLSKKITHEK